MNKPHQATYALAGGQALLETLQPEFSTPEEGRLDVRLPVDQLVEAVKRLLAVNWGFLSAITGVDLGGGDNGELEALYHFCQGPAVLTLRIPLPYENPALPSIDRLIHVAGIYERELKEMYGVEIKDMTDPRRLFLPEDWEADIYPMRKAFVSGQAEETDETGVC